MSHKVYIINVECPACGQVREVRSSWYKYPARKHCIHCARMAQLEKPRTTPVMKPKEPFTFEDPFSSGRLPSSVTANALWI